MSNLIDIFKNIEKEDFYWNGKNSGKELEDTFSIALKKFKYDKHISVKTEDIQKLKQKITKAKAENEEVLENEMLDVFPNGTYIEQPFGKQSFPDFIVFDNNKMIPIEAKYSKTNKPVWNNSIPERFAIYIIGTKNNITFCYGKNQMSLLYKQAIQNFFDEKSKELYKEFKKAFPCYNDEEHNPSGYFPYFRKNFQQKKLGNDKICINFFEEKKHKKNKKGVFDFLETVIYS